MGLKQIPHNPATVENSGDVTGDPLIIEGVLKKDLLVAPGVKIAGVDIANIDVTSGLAAHIAASDPHPGYLKESDVIDEDNMVSNLDTKVPTQQSVKAYTDALPSSVLADDIALKFGTGGTASVLWETADGNANALIIALPDAGATDIPVLIVGDQSLINKNLGLFDGITDPTIVLMKGDESNRLWINNYSLHTDWEFYLCLNNDVSHYFRFTADNSVPTIYGTGAYLRVGNAGTTAHSLDAEDDLMVSGDAEVKGALFVDGAATIPGILDNTAGGTDALTTKAPTSNALYDHAHAVIGVNAHPSNYYCAGYMNDTTNFRSGLPAAQDIRVPKFTVDFDPSNMIVGSDWKGTDGARIQADGAGCTSTNIHDADGGFTEDMRYLIVYTSSTANGITNSGIAIITTVTSTDLTIAKISGTNFANSYYYYFAHSKITIPVTGLWEITAQLNYDAGEANKNFYIRVPKYVGGAWTYTGGISEGGSSGATTCQVRMSKYLSITAGDIFTLAARHSGTGGTPGLYGNSTNCYIQFMLLQQTA
jgi:hypothetical protein